MSFYLTLSSLILSFVIHAVLTVRLDSDSKQLMGGCFNETKPLNCSDYGYPGYSIVDTSEHNKWCCVLFNDEEDDDFETFEVESEGENTVAETTILTLIQSQTSESNKLTAISDFESSKTTAAKATRSENRLSSGEVTSSDSVSKNKNLQAKPSQKVKEDSSDFEILKQPQNLNDSLKVPTNSTSSEISSSSEKLFNNEEANESSSSPKSSSTGAESTSPSLETSTFLTESTSSSPKTSTFLTESPSSHDSSSATKANKTEDILVIAPVDSNFNGALELVEDSDLTEVTNSTEKEGTTTASDTTDTKVTEVETIAQTETTVVMSSNEYEGQFEAVEVKEGESDEQVSPSGNVNESSPNEPSENSSKEDFVITTDSVTTDIISSMTDEQKEDSNKLPNKRFKAGAGESEGAKNETIETSLQTQGDEKLSENIATTESSFATSSNESSTAISEETNSTNSSYLLQSNSVQLNPSILEQNQNASKSQQETTKTIFSPDSSEKAPSSAESNEGSLKLNQTQETLADDEAINSTKSTENLPSTAVQQEPTTVQGDNSTEKVIANETATTTSSTSIEDEKITRVVTQNATLVEKSTNETEGGVTENQEELQTTPLNSTTTLNANISEAMKSEESTPKINDAADKKVTRATVVATAEPMIQVKVGKIKQSLF